MMAAGASRFDLARVGAEVFRPSPRQADVMIVAGTINKKMALPVKTLYDQMPEPKWVIAIGACASSGGMMNSYPTVQGVDEIVPVEHGERLFAEAGVPSPKFSLYQMSDDPVTIAAEVTYPTPEGTSNSLIQLFGQGAVIFVYVMEALKTANGSFTPSLLLAIGLILLSLVFIFRMKDVSYQE